MVQFQVTQVSRTENDFIMKGILLSGSLSKGMNIHVPLNNSLDVVGTITEINKVHDQFELVIGCTEQGEIEIWEMLNVNGDLINIM